MAFTRFHDDQCRIEKQLQQSTDQGRWILNVPGWGDKPAYMADPQIRIQTWGGNLMTNSIQLESELLGVNRPLNKDCLGKNEYKKYNVPSKPIEYPSCSTLTVEESRATCPAWTFRDCEQVDWYYPPFQPQENTCFPFQCNLSTRIIEKDNYVQQFPCITSSTNNVDLPVIRIGESSICTNSHSCKSIF